MRKAFSIFLVLLFAIVMIFAWTNSQRSPEKPLNSSEDNLTSPENHFTSTSTGSITSPSAGNTISKRLPLFCPRSIWGYGYVYPNETLTILLYPSIDYLKNTTFVDLYLGNISTSYSTSDVLSLKNSSGIAGRVPLPLYLSFQTPGKQFSITGNALLLQLWKEKAIVNESRMPVWLHFQIAPIKPEDVHLKFSRYSSLYTSFKKGLDTFKYTAVITNLYNKPIIIENVSFPLTTIQKYPKPPDIKITAFKLIDMVSNKTVTEIPPNSTAVLRVLVSVPTNVDGLYFKPKLMFKIGNESLAVPAPPMEYVRVADCG